MSPRNTVNEIQKKRNAIGAPRMVIIAMVHPFVAIFPFIIKNRAIMAITIPTGVVTKGRRQNKRKAPIRTPGR